MKSCQWERQKAKAAPNNCSKFRQLCLAVADDEVGGSRLWNSSSSPLASFHLLQEESREKPRGKVPGTAAPKQRWNKHPPEPRMRLCRFP